MKSTAANTDNHELKVVAAGKGLAERLAIRAVVHLIAGSLIDGPSAQETPGCQPNLALLLHSRSNALGDFVICTCAGGL